MTQSMLGMSAPSVKIAGEPGKYTTTTWVAHIPTAIDQDRKLSSSERCNELPTLSSQRAGVDVSRIDAIAAERLRQALDVGDADAEDEGGLALCYKEVVRTLDAKCERGPYLHDEAKSSPLDRSPSAC